MVHQCRRGRGERGEVTSIDCKTCPERSELYKAFDRVVLINLKRRPDRLLSLRNELSEKGWPFAQPQVFEAVDGSLVPTPDGWLSGAGAWGCMASHRRVLEQAISDGVKSLLVLEDDACIRHSFSQDVARFLSAVPDDWDQLMLGGQHIGNTQQVSDGVVRCFNCQRTHAYAIRGKMLRDLYALWCSPKSDRHCDHLMGPMQSRYKVYASSPFLFGQTRSHSDITNSVNPTKFWQPPTGREEVLVLRCDVDTVKRLRAKGVHTGYARDPVTDVDVGLTGPLTDVKLRRWVSDLQWECVSETGLTLGVWHPDATVEMVKRCWSGPVREVTSEDDL